MMRFRQFIDKSVLMSFHEIHRHFYWGLNQQIRALGLSFYEALILLAIFFEDQNDIHPSDLERMLGIPKDQVSQWVSRLEDRNLIRRKMSAVDRRKKSLHLLAPGQKISYQLIKIFDGHEERIEEDTLSISKDILKIAQELRQSSRP